MMKKTIEIEDTLQKRIDSMLEDVEQALCEWIAENTDADECPDLGTLDYSGRIHEIVDGSVPIYTGEQRDLWYLYGDDFEQAFDDAGIGEKSDADWPMGWKPAAIYCYLEEQVYNWFAENAEAIYDVEIARIRVACPEWLAEADDDEIAEARATIAKAA